MYGRELEGRTLDFGVSGKLIMNALVMYDRQTGSLWSQFLGLAVRGEFRGVALPLIGSTLTTWERWQELHPDTLLLSREGSIRIDPYLNYYRDESAGIRGETNRDERLGKKEFVLGVQLADAAKGYPFRDLSRFPLVQDRIGSTDVVVVFDDEGGAALAYDRRVGERTLTFDLAPPVEGAPIALADRETGSTWSALTGNALAGPLAGTRLQQLRAFPVFWFAWSDFFPEAELWDPEAAVTAPMPPP